MGSCQPSRLRDYSVRFDLPRPRELRTSLLTYMPTKCGVDDGTEIHGRVLSCVQPFADDGDEWNCLGDDTATVYSRNQWPTSQVAEWLTEQRGQATTTVYVRQFLDRSAITPIGRNPGRTGENLYHSVLIEHGWHQRVGQGTRSDKLNDWVRNSGTTRR